MRKTLCAAALVLAFCAPTFAGDIPNPLGTQPPPPPSATAEEKTTDDETQDNAADSLTETVLSVLESLLSLL